jgi:hypothetical protein
MFSVPWLTSAVASCDMDALLLLVLDPVVALLIGIIKWLVLYPITFVLVTPCIFIHAVFARDGFRETVSSDFEGEQPVVRMPVHNFTRKRSTACPQLNDRVSDLNLGGIDYHPSQIRA